MEKTFYWQYSKKEGRAFVYEKPGKKRVKETMKRNSEDSSITYHKFYFNGDETALTAHCGYDRGPKIQAIVKRMLGI